MEWFGRDVAQHRTLHVARADAFVPFARRPARPLVLEGVNAFLTAVVPGRAGVVVVGHQVAADLSEYSSIGVDEVGLVLVDQILNARETTRA